MNIQNDSNASSYLIIPIAESAGGLVILVALVVFLLKRRSTQRASRSALTTGKKEYAYDIAKKKRLEQGTDIPEGKTKTVLSGNTAVAVPAYLQVELNATVRLVNKIGEGGAGEVWLFDILDSKLIKDMDTHTAAVKLFFVMLILITIDKSPEEETSFLMEVSVANALSKHKNFTIMAAFCHEV